MFHAVARFTGVRLGAASLPTRVRPVLPVVVIITGTVVPDAANGMM